MARRKPTGLLPDGDRIAYERKRNGWTQELFADLTGLSPKTIVQAEAGIRKKYEILDRIASKLPGVLLQQIIIPDKSADEIIKPTGPMTAEERETTEIEIKPRDGCGQPIKPENLKGARFDLKTLFALYQMGLLKDGVLEMQVTFGSIVVTARLTHDDVVRLTDAFERGKLKALGIVAIRTSRAATTAKDTSPQPFPRSENSPAQTGQYSNAIELAEECERLMQKLQLSQAALAQHLGMSVRTLSKLLQVRRNLPETLVAAVRSGALPFRVAYIISRLQGRSDAQIDLAAKFMAATLDSGAVEMQVRRTLAASKKSGKQRPPVIRAREAAIEVPINLPLGDMTRFLAKLSDSIKTLQIKALTLDIRLSSKLPPE